MGKIFGSITSRYPISGEKERILQLLENQIEKESELKIGDSKYFEGIEVLSTETFTMNHTVTRSIFTAVLKVKEDKGKLFIESKVFTFLYFELTVFFTCLFASFSSSLIFYHYYVKTLPIKGNSPFIFIFFSLLISLIGVTFLYTYKNKGHKAINNLISKVLCMFLKTSEV